MKSEKWVIFCLMFVCSGIAVAGECRSSEEELFFVDMPVYARAVLLLPGTGSDRVEPDIMKMENVRAEKVKTLMDAVVRGLALCEKGDNLLFSPGFASFGMFKNEFDRGDQFNEIIKNLK